VSPFAGQRWRLGGELYGKLNQWLDLHSDGTYSYTNFGGGDRIGKNGTWTSTPTSVSLTDGKGRFVGKLSSVGGQVLEGVFPLDSDDPVRSRFYFRFNIRE
jgi:hypothetical protein